LPNGSRRNRDGLLTRAHNDYVSERDDEMAKVLDPQAGPETSPRANAEKKSGRPGFDADGRSVWEWQVSTGVFSRTVTEDQLLQLAQTNLELAQDGELRRESGLAFPSARPSAAARALSASPSSVTASASPTLGPVLRLIRRISRGR
jgi:hypothetical protein